jgi:hypothetical protein
MEEQWENYSCAHIIDEHVDGCWGSDALMDNRISSLDQVGSGNEIVCGPCH